MDTTNFDNKDFLKQYSVPVFEQPDQKKGQRNFTGDSQNARSDRDNFLNKFTANQANKQATAPMNLNIESSITLDNQY